MLLIYKLLLSNSYFLLGNQLYVRSKNKCYKTSIANIEKTVIILILYILSKNLTRVNSLSGILETNMIVLRLDLSKSFIIWSASLQPVKKLIAVFIQIYGSSSTIFLLNYFDINIFQIIITLSNSPINLTDSILLILLAALGFLYKSVLYQLISFIYL